MQAAEQAEHHIGLANARVPPGWSVEQDKSYALRVWIRDVELWAAATDVPEPRQAPAIVLRLTGLVRHILREVPVQLFTQGQDYNDAFGQPQHRTGVEVLIRLLQQRYGALPQEALIFLVSELMTFHRQPSPQMK